MERRNQGLVFYSLKATPWKEREDLREGFDVGIFGRQRRCRLGEGGTPDKWVHSVSGTVGEGTLPPSSRVTGPAAGFSPRRNATRALGDGPRGRGSGEELEQATGEGWAETEKIKIFVFFFLFNYFKAFSNDFET
jgi:hypothetical protein